MTTLLMPREVDRLLRYPRGRSMKLARSGKLPHIKLPDGEVRFDQAEIDRLLDSLRNPTPSALKEVANAS